jgi:formylglycine-generating enzyme required for sulfatase activity
MGKALSLKMMGDIPAELKSVMEEGKPEGEPAPAEDLDLYRFIQIPATEEVPYPFWIGKYPVTNAQYARFLDAPDFGKEEYWKGFLKFNEDCIQIGRWKDEGWQWLQKESKGKRIEPRYWQDDDIGIYDPENPVVGITWFEANAYCNWLFCHWQGLAESRANSGLSPCLLRLPLETEWVVSAGGDSPSGRYPWDPHGKVSKREKEIVMRANVKESNIGHTTPVRAYLRGSSPHGVMDMSGNIWEFQGNHNDLIKEFLTMKGGSTAMILTEARVASRSLTHPSGESTHCGFRLGASPR